MVYKFKEALAAQITRAIDRWAGKNLPNYSEQTHPEVIIEVPSNVQYGEFSTAVALQLARLARCNPRQLAVSILAELFSEPDPFFTAFDHLTIDAGQISYDPNLFIAGAGFLNFSMKDSFWTEMVNQINEQGTSYGETEFGHNQKIQVEFVSANPTGPLHIGHGRSAAYGDALARVLKMAGFNVQREYYINDAGRQMSLLGESLKARYLQKLGQPAQVPPDGYQGEYMIGIADKLANNEKERHLDAEVDFFTRFAVGEIISSIESDLDLFNVVFDNWFSEKRELHDTDQVNQTLEYLKSKGAIYEKDGAYWLKTGSWEEQDRVVINSQGIPTYLAGDIAYHKNKFERGFEVIIDIWGHDHHGYQPRMKAMVEALGHNPQNLHLIVYQLVSLSRSGVPVKMSTRTGQFITLREVIDEVGVDAVRYFFNMRSPDSQMEFDLELAKKASSDNPVYYVQYAHARICSIFRNMSEYGLSEEMIANVNVDLLTSGEEKSLIKKLAEFPELVIKCARTYEPHHLTSYLQEMAGVFHGYYKRHRIMDRDSVELSCTRLKLMQALKIVIHNGLELLGVSAPERM